jgi:hypothetical protein
LRADAGLNRLFSPIRPAIPRHLGDSSVQGPIAQAIGLTLFGNAFLQNHPPSDFWPNASVFAFCKSVTFVTLSGPANAPIEAPMAPDPAAWFAALRDGGVTALRLHHNPSDSEKYSDRMTVGFVGGGGRWLIEALRGTSCDHWEARWRVKDRNDPERRIWEVAYGRLAVNRPANVTKTIDPSVLREDLATALAEITTFAQKHALASFIDAFEDGRSRLQAESPFEGLHHADFDRCRSLPLVGKQLLGAAEAAWVFGGMGSWNDMSFEGEDEATYNTLSDRLFSLLMAAIVAGANASCAQT